MAKTTRTRPDQKVVVSDDALILDLRQAKMPGIVRLKFDDLTLAYFHIRTNADGSTLGFSTGREDFVVLGVFSDRGDADGVLKELREQLLRIETRHKFFTVRTLMLFLGTLVFLLVLGWVYGKVTTPRLPDVEAPISFDEPVGETATPPAGLPMDADKKLTPPE
jgi:hypothetical protein